MLEVVLIIISVLLFIWLILTRIELKGKMENISTELKGKMENLSNQLNLLFNQIGGTFGKSLSTITDIHERLGAIETTGKELLDGVKEMNSTAMVGLHQQLGAIKTIDESVREKLDKISTSTLTNICEQLSKIETTLDKSVLEELKEISTIKDLLKPPQMRGKIGEISLENLLSLYFPSQLCKSKYKLPSGKIVDFVIEIKDYLVPIDAKFTLDNLEKMMRASTPGERKRHRENFVEDVKKRINETKGYISPEAGTYFALMYLPSEAAYYEAFITDTDAYEYALENRVIPVSPSTFYSFLTVLLFGFKGLKMEEKARLIVDEISALKSKIDDFYQAFQELGKHVKGAYDKYVYTDRKFSEFKIQVDKFEKI